MIQKILLLFVTLIFTSCSSIQINQVHSIDQETDFDTLAQKLANSSICQSFDINESIYVTDFVNQKNYTNQSELGFILSDALKVNLQKSSCSQTLKIKALNLSKYLYVDDNGFSMVTRKLSQLKEKNLQDNKKIIIGTYTISANQLLVFVKLIDLKTNDTLATSTAATPITYEILQLDGHEFKIEQDNRPFHL